MDEQKMIRIETFLNQNGMSISTISKSRLVQFEKIDYAIQKRFIEIENAKEVLKSSTINVSVIANDTGISRKTFYNNDLLKAFVEEYATNNDEKSVALSELDKIKNKNSILQKQINGFVLRDIETENLRHEIKDLNREIQSLQNRNDALEYQNETLQEELSETKQQLVKNTLSVVK